MDRNKSLVGVITTGGTSPEPLLLSVDGATPAATVSFSADRDLVITDAILSPSVKAEVSWEASTDGGSTWFNMFPSQKLAGYGTHGYTFANRKVVERVGGVAIQVRANVTTPDGAGDVQAGLETYES